MGRPGGLAVVTELPVDQNPPRRGAPLCADTDYRFPSLRNSRQRASSQDVTAEEDKLPLFTSFSFPADQIQARRENAKSVIQRRQDEGYMRV